MALRLVRLLIVVVALTTFPAAAEEWPRARISRLPDSASAVVETVPAGASSTICPITMRLAPSTRPT